MLRALIFGWVYIIFELNELPLVISILPTTNI